MLLCVAAVASIQGGSGRAVLLPDEVDGLELNAYLTPSDVEEFKKVSAGGEQHLEQGSRRLRRRWLPVGSSLRQPRQRPAS
jgi:hypothetical protein